MTKREKQRYKYLAYVVIRDALGFYLGINKFFQDLDVDAVVQDKISNGLSDADARQHIKHRLKGLQQDLEHAQQTLFTPNIWLMWLNLHPSYVKEYVEKLTDDEKEVLAVVPTWKTRDHSLRRPYLVDDKNTFLTNVDTDERTTKTTH